MNEAEKFDQHAIIELMGHQRIAGRVTEQAIGGTSFVRVDVPEIDGRPGFTKLFGSSAIYAITFVDEDIARAAAKQYRPAPVDYYTLQDVQRQIEHQQERTGEAEDFDDDHDDDHDMPRF